MKDSIHIAELELMAHIGVPDEERLHPQRLTISATLFPHKGFADLHDAIENTVDYFLVCQTIKALAAHKPRKLIETLAQEIAQTLLAEFPLESVSLELRKFILPDTAHVAVRITRPCA